MKLLYVILGTIIFFIGQSCNSVKHNYERLMGSQVIFPETLQRVEKQDTLPFVTNNDNAHMVIYYDSTQCNTCAVSKLGDWESLIEDAKSIYEDIDFVFIMSPTKSDQKKVMRDIAINYSNYNVAFDDSGAFSQSNPQIPQDNRFHAMLLDKNNNVVLIGNPLYSNSIWELMKEALMNIKNNNGQFVAN